MVRLNINGKDHDVDVDPNTPLLWAIRENVGLTGTKYGCGIAQCGACTVHIDGKPVRSCVLPVGAVRDRAITTIEGVGASPAGAKVPLWLRKVLLRGLQPRPDMVGDNFKSFHVKDPDGWDLQISNVTKATRG